MGLETATWIDDLQITNPLGTDKKSQGDDHIRLLKSVLRNVFPRAGKAFPFPQNLAKSADYTVVATDQNSMISVDTTGGSVTLTLPTLASGDAGWSIEVIKTNTGTNPVFIAPPSGTINGFSKVRRTLEYLITKIVWNGSNFYASRPNGGNIGDIRTFAGASLPNDCLWPDGATFTAANFVELNSKLGGNTKPDMRGRIGIGLDNLGGSAAGRMTGWTTLGMTGGEMNHTLTVSEAPTGQIGLSDPGHTHALDTGGFAITTNGGTPQGTGSPGLGAGPISVATTGISVVDHAGGQGHNNVQPSMGLNMGLVAE